MKRHGPTTTEACVRCSPVHAPLPGGSSEDHPGDRRFRSWRWDQLPKRRSWVRPGLSRCGLQPDAILVRDLAGPDGSASRSIATSPTLPSRRRTAAPLRVRSRQPMRPTPGPSSTPYLSATPAARRDPSATATCRWGPAAGSRCYCTRGRAGFGPMSTTTCSRRCLLRDVCGRRP